MVKESGLAFACPVIASEAKQSPSKEQKRAGRRSLLNLSSPGNEVASWAHWRMGSLLPP